MKKIIVIIGLIFIVIGIIIYFAFINNNSSNEIDEDIENNEDTSEDSDLGDENMRISVRDGSHEIIFELNDSSASKSLYEQLPLTLDVENFSSNEKIFYPTSELDTDSTPISNGGGEGTLAYYAPWGDVVMFYDSFTSASGLYELGVAVSGTDQIGNLSGEITIEKLEN